VIDDNGTYLGDAEIFNVFPAEYHGVPLKDGEAVICDFTLGNKSFAFSVFPLSKCSNHEALAYGLPNIKEYMIRVSLASLVSASASSESRGNAISPSIPPRKEANPIKDKEIDVAATGTGVSGASHVTDKWKQL
jgi:hypothetical protein